MRNLKQIIRITNGYLIVIANTKLLKSLLTKHMIIISNYTTHKKHESRQLKIFQTSLT